MDDRGDEGVATIAARWRDTSPEGAAGPQGTTDARGDIAVLLDELARLRRQLDALTPPAKDGTADIAACCERLRRYLADPDNVIDYWAELDQFLLPVRGGTRSAIVIAFCPWCGSPLPVPPPDRDAADGGAGR